MMNEKMEQLNAVLADEVFVRSLAEAENEKAVQKMLADKGVEMSLTEIELVGEVLGALADGKITEEDLSRLKSGGELSEDELEQAAGGKFEDIFYTYRNNLGYEIDGAAYRMFSDWGLNPTKSISNPTIAAGVAIGVAAAVGLGYGVYDAVRRRW